MSLKGVYITPAGGCIKEVTRLGGRLGWFTHDEWDEKKSLFVFGVLTTYDVFNQCVPLESLTPLEISIRVPIACLENLCL